MRFRISKVEQTSGLRRTASLCAAVTACLALPAVAGDQSPSDVPAASKVTEAPSAGMRTAIDPATGTLRPLTAAEAKALDDMDRAAAAAASAKSSKKQGVMAPKAGESFKTASGATGVVLDESYMVDSEVSSGEPFTTPNGAIGMHLDDSQMVYSVVTRGADGKLEMECLTGKENADNAVNGNRPSEKNNGGKSDETK